MYPVLLLLGIWLQSTPFIETSTLIIPILQLKNTRFDGGGGLVTKSCPTLATPCTVAGQVLSMGFSRLEDWSGLLSPFCNWRTQGLDGLFHLLMATWPRRDRASWFSVLTFVKYTTTNHPYSIIPHLSVPNKTPGIAHLSISHTACERTGHFLLTSVPECLTQWHQYQWNK